MAGTYQKSKGAPLAPRQNQMTVSSLTTSTTNINLLSNSVYNGRGWMRISVMSESQDAYIIFAQGSTNVDPAVTTGNSQCYMLTAATEYVFDINTDIHWTICVRTKASTSRFRYYRQSFREEISVRKSS